MTVKTERELRKIGIIFPFNGCINAEYETIKRMEIALSKIGYESIVIDEFGVPLSPEQKAIDTSELLFAISLHFVHPKFFDCFTYYALWNPIQFYHDWGYERYSYNVLSYDDYLSNYSEGLVAHARRLMEIKGKKVDTFSTLCASLASPIIDPIKGVNKKLFYCGVNWERLSGKNNAGRHGSLTTLLDQHEGVINFYGPKLFMGMQPWEGFKNYKGEIPFDGVSLVQAISDCGISLCLSSKAHLHSATMSSRLYEGCAAGSIIISDENRFVKEHFKDSILYIDSSQGPQKVYEQILQYHKWINNHPEEAYGLACRSQSIFKEKFSLDVMLKGVIENHPVRKQQIEKVCLSQDQEKKVLVVAIDNNSENKVGESFLKNLNRQIYKNFELAFIIDPKDKDFYQQVIDSLSLNFKVHLHFYENIRKENFKINKGSFIYDLINSYECDHVMMTQSDEVFFGEHISSLVRSLDDNKDAKVAISDCIYSYGGPSNNTNKHQMDYSCSIKDSLFETNFYYLVGFGRFLFKKEVISKLEKYWFYELDLTLPLFLYYSCLKNSRPALTFRGSILREIDVTVHTPSEKVVQELQVSKDFLRIQSPSSSFSDSFCNEQIKYLYKYLNKDSMFSSKSTSVPQESLFVNGKCWLRDKMALFLSMAGRSKKIIIFGTGIGGRNVYKGLPFKCKVIAFADNNQAKHGQAFLGREIVSPVKLKSMAFDYIIIGSMAHPQIRRQLLQSGIPQEKIKVASQSMILNHKLFSWEKLE